MSAQNCMCQETGLLVFPCSGGSDVGELSDRVGRTIAKCGQAKMFCLAGIGAHIPGMIESAKAAKRIISIDGCSVSCAKKTLEHAGLKVEAYNLKDLGFEKGKTKVDENSIKSATSKIAGGKIEETVSRTSGGCCTK
ncbi:MAG TPA: putative zinc-binding protein [Candidatus Omnitrophota bacterium]|nr:putative zinc-binding protein [Candidatus Omnitrophota bacterium]HPT39131.1 putative zinc-binding protein [Candidatus Omnitrophota bacterium]